MKQTDCKGNSRTASRNRGATKQVTDFKDLAILTEGDSPRNIEWCFRTVV